MLDVPQHSTQTQSWRSLPSLIFTRQWRWVTLGVIVLALVFVRLGVWQLDRLAARQANNARIEERITLEPIMLTGQELDPVANEYRQATVRGTFDHEHAVLLRNRSFNGVPGVDLLTPLRIEGSDQAVLVDRGWIPLEQSTPEARRQFNEEGSVEVLGIVRPPRTNTSRFAPLDRVTEDGRLDAWFWPDVARIGQQVPYTLLPFYLEATQPTDPAASLPHPQPRIEIDEGPHLGYAIQWFSFAVVLVVGYGAVVVTRSQGRP